MVSVSPGPTRYGSDSASDGRSTIHAEKKDAVFLAMLSIMDISTGLPGTNRRMVSLGVTTAYWAPFTSLCAKIEHRRLSLMNFNKNLRETRAFPCFALRCTIHSIEKGPAFVPRVCYVQ